MFGDLSALHRDKGVWRLVDRPGGSVKVVPVPGSIPPDVDTWSDYEKALAVIG